jgi:phage-related protein
VAAFAPVGLTLPGPTLPQLVMSLGTLGAAVVRLWAVSMSLQAQLLVPLMNGLTDLATGLVVQAFPGVQLFVSAMGPMLATALMSVLPLVGVLAGCLLQLLPALSPIADLVAQIASGLLPPLVLLFAAILSPVLLVVSAIVSLLVPALKVVIEVIAWLVKIAILALIAAFKDVITTVPTLGAVFGTIGGLIKGGFDGVVSFVRGIFNTITGLVNGIIDGINPVTSAAGGAVGIHVGPIPHLPMLAEGATILPTPGGTVVRVAEAGKAETVVNTDKLNKMLDQAPADDGATYAHHIEGATPEAVYAQYERRVRLHAVS